MNEITLSLETLTVQGIQALDPNDNYCPKQPIFQNTAQCVGVAAVSASLSSDAETATGANAYHSEKSLELAHQEDLRDRSQIHSRVLDLSLIEMLLPCSNNLHQRLEKFTHDGRAAISYQLKLHLSSPVVLSNHKLFEFHN